ncbi:MAG: ribosome maturation factor RimM [Salinivirgaceae bacterium]|nr:ribosome maturation factor RimM [Salinivirgaceae bacterium]
MSIDDSSVIGQVVKVHGIAGELMIETDSPEILEDITEPVFLEIEGLRVPFFVEWAKINSGRRVRIKFDDVNDEKKALQLVGCPVLVSNDWLDGFEEEELPEQILVGFNIIDTKHGNIGSIDGFENMDINPTMVINHNGNNVLIPFHPDFINDINRRKRSVNVTLPDGLLEIYL